MPSLIAAANTAQVVHVLENAGVFERMRAGRRTTAGGLLDGLVEPIGLELLRYCAVRGIVEIHDDEYRLTLSGEMLTGEIPMARLRFYVDAYGPVLAALPDLLTGKAVYGQDVQRRGGALSHASATIFARYYSALVLESMRGRGSRRVLDLGCGSGQLLLELVRAHPGITGVGVDVSPEAVEVAREAAARHGVADRLEFRVADAFAPLTWPPACADVDTVTAVGMLHELFREGDQAVVDALNTYAGMLGDGRSFLLGEPEPYYDDRENDADFLLVHALSNQGSPRDRATWLRVIARSQLSCNRLLTPAGAGPRTVFYDLVRT